MKIAIDASRAINETAGVGTYTRYLIENMISVDKKNDYQLFFNFWRDFQKKSKQAESYKQKNVQVFCRRLPGQIKEKLLRSKFGYYRGKLNQTDVFLAPTFLDVDFASKTKQVVVIYDLSMFYYPDHLGKDLSLKFQKKTDLACQKATKIIAISESTKKDLMKLLNVPEEKIAVIYPGSYHYIKIADQLPDDIKLKSYILAVGTIEPRKNLKNLLLAYNLLPENLKADYSLIIAGGKGWNTQEELRTIGRSKNVKWLGYISDEELAKLYKEAAVFAYPSLYEGFGFPILEAMQFGTPVITSNTSSMPEVAGKAAILINPDDIKSVSEGLQTVLEGKNSRLEMNKAGIAQDEKFSWEKCAQETLKFLEKLG